MADGSHIHDPDTGPGEGRWHAPDEVWAAVRTDYLAGMSAPEACRRYGVGLSALRARAAREGWRRADQPWTPPNRLDPDDEGAELEARVDGNLDRVDLPDLVWVAYRRMMRAVVRGQAVEALRWRRVHAAMVDEQAETERFFEQEDVIRQARVDADAVDAVDAVDASDASDGVFSGEG